ncbi:hypothetical protein CHLNCDRAFT_136764 [Chlorella variabilis]|uniref:UspA domain-containing protein n=1 Tax=Chlorella variabilis TaxID=554065 RepID=E1ZL11_CHLVA|nr:hypothetical protein CHLNCDRAFT_136764 [Chlorella variabilis]EFN53480.1 hypothetical protein CHLNCDRAFT_136764 [Chlorella variabilis]|eukprot:XP_005845582.1 hypothetical protein CHLNCDRAFT_136764 [Chlorella variabilis]
MPAIESEDITGDYNAHAAASLREALNVLQRSFAGGVGDARDFPQSLEVLKQLQRTFATEAAVAAGEQLAAVEQPQAEAGAGSGKHVLCMLDGSLNSFTSLSWAVDNLVDPEDEVYLLTAIPYQDYQGDAERILQEGYDFAHNAGIAPARLHPRTLTASGGSATRGVGESLAGFVEGEQVDVVVLGSRGMGSIKRSIMGSLGMGSVSDYCVQHLRCPILVIKEGSQPGAPGE